MRRTMAIGLFLVIPAVLPAGPVRAADDAAVLAEVDGDPITLADLKQEFAGSHMGHEGMLADTATLRSFLEASIRRTLFVHEARRMGLDEDPRVRNEVDRTRRREMTRWLYRDRVESRISVAPEEVEAAWTRLGDVRDVVLIQVDTRGDAEEVRNALLDGDDAETLARHRSTADSSDRGGLERVVWGAKPPLLEEAIFTAAPEAVTEPVQGEDGWMVAKVLEEQEIEPSKLRLDRAYVARVLRKRAGDRLRSRYLDGLRDTYAARVHRDLLGPKVLNPWVGAAAPPAGDRPVAEFRGGKILLSDLAGAIEPAKWNAWRPGRRRLRAEQILSNLLDQALLGQEAERLWPSAPASVRAKVRAREDELLFRILLGGTVFRGIEVSSGEVQAWYEAHPNRYVEPPQVRLAVALLPTEKEAGEFLAAVASGKEFARLARERSTDPETAQRGGVAGWVSPKQAIPQLRDEPFRKAKGEAGGPVRVEGGWLVYQVLDRREARRREVSEVEDKVRADVTERKSSARQKEWEQKLRAVAKIRVRERAVERVGKQLEAEARSRLAPGNIPAHTAHPPHGGAGRTP